MNLSSKVIRTAATAAERAAGSHVIPWRGERPISHMRRKKGALSSGCKLRPGQPLQPEATKADLDAMNGWAS